MLIIISALMQLFSLPNDLRNIWDLHLTTIGMLNWIPFFCFFWTAQIYLDSEKDRKNAALILIAGSFPVLISGLGQYFLNWIGPFEALNGLIIWYQKPISLTDGLTGPFNNANYAGSWLALVRPFSIYYFLRSKKKTKNLQIKTVSKPFKILTLQRTEKACKKHNR